MPATGDAGFFQMQSQLVRHRIEFRIGHRVVTATNRNDLRGFGSMAAEGLDHRAAMGGLSRAVGRLANGPNFFG